MQHPKLIIIIINNMVFKTHSIFYLRLAFMVSNYLNWLKAKLKPKGGKRAKYLS